MNTRYVLKEVGKVTEIAKNIFGNIVSKVYYADYYQDYQDYQDYEGRENIVEKMDYLIKNSFNTEESIEQDGKNIVIEFTNGRKVLFSNSEWGSMESFSDSEIKEVI